MKLRGPNGGGEEDGEDVRESADDALMPFFTPQHHRRSPSQSYFSINTSQDSLDVYHDAYSTLTRPPSQNVIGQRKRHVSLGAGAVENGYLMEDDFMDDIAETTEMLPKEPGSGRVRHASCSTVNNRFRTSPCHIGRLSLSTNSIRRKMMESDAFAGERTQKTGSAMKMGSLQKLGTRGNGVIGYVPCAEMPQVAENVNAENEPVARDNRVERPAINEAWMKNYVVSVETEKMLGNNNAEDLSSHEIQLCPGRIEQPRDTAGQMYSFKPVQPRRVGLQRFKDEFKTENLRLHHKTPHLLVSSQWQQHNRMSCLYLGYRLFWAIYFTMWAVWAWIGSMGYNADISQKFYFLIYTTNWGIWTLAVDTTIQAINVIRHFKKISEEGDAIYPSMPRLFKVSWVLSNITGALHIFITLAYWITVYPFRSDEKLNEIGVNTHIMPGVYVLTDVMVSATPRRLLHAYQPSLFLTTYTLFNLIYFLCGGTDYMGRPALYPVLDWTRPGSTIGIITTVLVIVIPILHGCICGLYAARLKAWRILKISRYVREEDETDQVEQGAQEQKV